jgi:hypothetical protein
LWAQSWLKLRDKDGDQSVSQVLGEKQITGSARKQYYIVVRFWPVLADLNVDFNFGFVRFCQVLACFLF